MNARADVRSPLTPSVNVDRYAIHKLIVATVRNVFSQDKAKKDINQAGALIRAFDTSKRASDLGFAWMEAWERGARWRRRVGVGALRLTDETFSILAKGVADAAKLDGKLVEEYGMEDGKQGLLAHLGHRKVSTSPSP